MRITRRQLRKLIRESANLLFAETRRRDMTKVNIARGMSDKFQFSIDPQDYLSSELDFEGLRAMVELILDGDNINYHLFDSSYDAQLHNDVVYEFGYTSQDEGEVDGPLEEEPDPKSYQAFITLIEALQKSGIPTWFEAMKSRNFKVPSYLFHDYPSTPTNDFPYSFGTLRLRAPRKAQRGSAK